MKKHYRFFFIGLLLVLAGTISSVNGVMADSIEKLSIQGENFVNEQGEPVRFWGFNVVSLYPTHKQADTIAEELASYGVNVVRPHHTTRNAQYNWNNTSEGGSGVGALIEYNYNNNTTRTPNREAYERFDYFNFKLREKGIYTRLSLDGTRTYLPGDVDILITDKADRTAWSDAMDVLNKLYWEQSRDLRRMLPAIDERVALLNEEFIENFLTHKNPYTNLTYGQDPQTLTLEVANETSTEYAIVAGNRFVRADGKLTYSDGTKLSEADAAKLQYWEDKLMAKWNAYLTSIGISEDQHFDLYSGLTNDNRKQIRAEFLKKLDEDYFLRIKKLVREKIGCDTPITHSTFWRGENNLKMHADNGDYIEEHSYSDPLVPGAVEDLFEIATRQTRVTDMPYFVGELNQSEKLINVPSRTTLLFSSAVYGSFYNWTGINFFAWNHGDQYIDENGMAESPFRIPDLSDDIPKSFLIGELQKDSMMLDHLRTAGILYKKGYVRESTQKKIDYVDAPYWASGYQALMTPKYAFQSGWQSVHSIYKEFTADKKSIPLTQAISPRFQQEIQRPVISDTNEIVKDVDKKQLRVQAPQAEGFSGFTYNAETVLSNHLQASGQEGSATVILVSSDGEEISDSEHMIISNTALAHSHKARLNEITGTEYHMELSVKNLKKAGAGTQWEFEVTRPAEAAGVYVLTVDADGTIALPASWNEGELRLVRNTDQGIDYTLRLADGTPLAALPPEGGNVSLSMAFGGSMQKPVQMITALYDTENFEQLAYRCGALENNRFDTGEILIPQQPAKVLGQVSQTQYTDITAQDGAAYEYEVQGYSQGQPVGEPQVFKKSLFEQESEKPAPAENLKALDLRGRSVTLEWEPSGSGAVDGYDIYRDGVRIAGGIEGNTYTDTSVQPQTTYVYEIRAVSKAAKSMGVSARVSTPEDTDLVFQFYKNGIYTKGTTYNRLDDSAQLAADTISAGQATALVPEGTKVLRYKMTANNGTQTPDKMPYVNIIWGSSLQQSISYSLENIIGTTAVKLYINMMEKRQQTEIGFLNKNEDGSISSIRLPLRDYIETENSDFVTAKEPLVWQEVVIPLSDFVNKGVYYNGAQIIPEPGNAFNWGQVIGITFAQSNEGYAINSCRLHDIKLITLEQPETVSGQAVVPDAYQQTGGIMLQWTPVAQADSYRISRRGGRYGLKIFLWERDGLKPLIKPVVIR